MGCARRWGPLAPLRFCTGDSLGKGGVCWRGGPLPPLAAAGFTVLYVCPWQSPAAGKPADWWSHTADDQWAVPIPWRRRSAPAGCFQRGRPMALEALRLPQRRPSQWAGLARFPPFPLCGPCAARARPPPRPPSSHTRSRGSTPLAGPRVDSGREAVGSGGVRQSGRGGCVCVHSHLLTTCCRPAAGARC